VSAKDFIPFLNDNFFVHFRKAAKISNLDGTAWRDFRPPRASRAFDLPFSTRRLDDFMGLGVFV